MSKFNCSEHGQYWHDGEPCEHCEPAKLCPDCGEALREREGRFPDCESCGFEQYDADTLALIAEVKREQAICKQVFGEIPSYGEAREKGFAR